MEPLDTDMDDLFRKAGDLYPLKTNESDWDAVMGKLQEKMPGDAGLSSAMKTKSAFNRRWLLLLLLIPLTVVSVGYFNSRSKQSQPLPFTENPAASAGNTPATSKTDATTNTPAGSATSEPTASKPLSASKISQGYSNSHELNSTATKVSHPKGVPGAGTVETPIIAGGTKAESRAAEKATGEITEKTNLVPADNKTSTNAATMATAIAATATKKEEETAKKETKKPTVSTKGFYIGLEAGPDWSSIKMQSVYKTGFSLGALVGYRFNQHLSVETGLFLDRKYYYTSGEYFETAKLTTQPPPITDLNGYCDMFEIPINVKYRFGSLAKSGFFAKAGFSSYLMKKEDYTFYYANPIPPFNYSKHNTSNTLFSVFQISGGYEMSVGKQTQLSFEPYLKIPLQGVGIGNIPISSAGIYIGITHSFR